MNKSNVVYQVPCKTCPKNALGEAGRTLATRIKKGVHKISDVRYTRSARKESIDIIHTFTITDHARRNNCIINWDDVKVLATEQNRHNRWIKESIEIRKMNDILGEGACCGGFPVVISHMRCKRLYFSKRHEK